MRQFVAARLAKATILIWYTASVDLRTWDVNFLLSHESKEAHGTDTGSGQLLS